jgi:hypothetical protein
MNLEILRVLRDLDEAGYKSIPSHLNKEHIEFTLSASGDRKVRLTGYEDSFSVNFFRKKKLCRDPADGPASLDVGYDGKVMDFTYSYEGQHHRPYCNGKPALFQHWYVGDMYIEVYRTNGKDHRPHTDGPSSVMIDILGDINYEYKTNGVFHRPVEDGPASFNFKIVFKTGTLVVESFKLDMVYYENGKEIPLKEVARRLNGKIDILETMPADVRRIIREACDLRYFVYISVEQMEYALRVGYREFLRPIILQIDLC